MDARVMTKKSRGERISFALGFNDSGVLDELDRSKFSSDAEYLDAAAKLEMERRNPEYGEIRSRLERELQKRREAEQTEKNAEAFQKILGTVQLDNFDVKNIDKQAAELARRDLAQGKISASGLGVTIENHAKQLTERKKAEYATNQMMNMMFRGQM